MNSVLISIADCNHGFWEPEEEECKFLSQDGKHVHVVYQDCTQDNLAEKCMGSDIIAVQRLSLDKDVISRVPTCKVVVRLGVGIDNICVADMENLGVKVVYFPDFCTEEVANHALSLILSSYRRLNSIQEYQSKLSKSTWGRPDLLESVRSAPNTTVGILGYGRIGRQVAKRLEVCGFNIIVCDPYVSDSIASSSLKELFTISDIVTIHCSLTEETKDMISYDIMSRMKMGSVLVNTARGGVVNYRDLKLLLDSSHIRMAYVDVFDPEPADRKSLSHKNLYVTPHIAFYSLDSLDYLKRNFVKKSVEVFYDM